MSEVAQGGRGGLTSAEAARRLEEVGPNEIAREQRTPVPALILRQFTSPLVVLLVGAGILAGAMGEWIDAIAIAAIVNLNAIVGFIQEYRAEAAVHALRKMTAPHARVVRDGHVVDVQAREVVPGDVLVLEAGDVVAADGRIVEANTLESNEAALTGESQPVRKRAEPAAAEAPLAERHDRVFLGTAVVRGTGLAEVEATGMRTEFGGIANLMAEAEQTVTPLQRELAGVSRTLLLLCLALVGVIAGLGLAHGRPGLEVLMAAVTLAVAAVPEGLPAVVTIALAVGVQRMAARNVLVRRLASVETLGAATVICTDKTGTLTTGEMAVREVVGDERAVLWAAAAASDAEIGPQGATGDTTEIALLHAAERLGIHRADIEREAPREAVTPFDSERKRMSIRRADGKLYVKGAPDVIIPLCTRGAEGALEANEALAERALRVLAVAVGAGTEEKDLELLGLVGLADPPRPEAVDAIAKAHAAGIVTVMITGDHPKTARAIAREIGVADEADLDDRVHARVTAEDKLRIVRDWKHRGAVVAMTGDGVNDAPALREASIGIAMGRTGTEVTREAADMVLADDNFASIVAAIREGRGIYANIHKTLVYLLVGNAGELAVMLGASILAWPLPLVPLHLLWINLVTDGLPALALVVDPTEPDALERPPRRTDRPMLGAEEWAVIAAFGLLDAVVVLGVYGWVRDTVDVATARTIAFTTIVHIEIFRVFAVRSRERVLFEVGAFTNPRLIAVVVATVGLQLLVATLPFARELLHIVPLEPGWYLTAVALGLVPVSVWEIAKLVLRALGVLRRR